MVRRERLQALLALVRLDVVAVLRPATAAHSAHTHPVVVVAGGHRAGLAIRLKNVTNFRIKNI